MLCHVQSLLRMPLLPLHPPMPLCLCRCLYRCQPHGRQSLATHSPPVPTLSPPLLAPTPNRRHLPPRTRRHPQLATHPPPLVVRTRKHRPRTVRPPQPRRLVRPPRTPLSRAQGMAHQLRPRQRRLLATTPPPAVPTRRRTLRHPLPPPRLPPRRQLARTASQHLPTVSRPLPMASQHPVPTASQHLEPTVRRVMPTASPVRKASSTARCAERGGAAVCRHTCKLHRELLGTSSRRTRQYARVGCFYVGRMDNT